MPVTFSPAPHNQIESFRGGPCSTSAALLDTVLASTDKRVAPRHLQSSFGRDGAQPISISPQRNGLVDTVLAAYSHHHALTIRPDDVWLAILAQFSLFVNGASRAEQLRHLFVAHEGKQTVRAAMDGGMATADYGLAARSMTKALHEHVVDAGLRDWCLPRFSTTTPTDTVVASVLMMATLKSYFRYEFSTRCGLPRVTLLGEQDDWLDIFHRVDKLASYGAEAAAWRDLLKPVLARFVQAFEPGCAESEENVDFWQRVVHVGPNQSGGQRLSGWLTAFCAFDDKGAWVGPAQEDERPKCSKRVCITPATGPPLDAQLPYRSLTRPLPPMSPTLVRSASTPWAVSQGRRTQD
jgi:hypothetical protein